MVKKKRNGRAERTRNKNDLQMRKNEKIIFEPRKRGVVKSIKQGTVVRRKPKLWPKLVNVK